MKQKLTLLLSFLVFIAVANAQMTDSKFTSAKKGTLVGIHFNALDLKTPLTFKSAAGNRTFSTVQDMDYGFSISYWKGLTNTIDLSARAGLMFHDYNTIDRAAPTPKGENIGIELEPTLNFRPYGDNAIISPFLTAGIGVGAYNGKFGAYIPAGVGVQFNFNSLSYLFIQSQYRFTLDKKTVSDNMFYSLGFAQNISKEKPAPVAAMPAPAVVKDTDGDGVADADDKCPTVAGKASLQGCPDGDGDGITDADDKCPTVAGTAKYNGCPIPDGDADGVNDEEDKCPTVKGFARYNGCPIPDTDGDGVNDEEDKCVDRKGPASNQGCPEIAKAVVDKINYAAKNVFFATGSFKLLPKSYKALDEVAALLKSDESLMIDVDGHTDSQGDEAKNQTLSDNRAAAVKTYLVSKGIADARLKSTGYGSTKAVGDNKTAAGRASNRRTELAVRNF
jgi:OmpA-OmpF porin, OOP family